MLQAYVQFAHVVGEIEGFDHLLEVFLPNIKLPGMDDEKRGMYVADSIVRTMRLPTQTPASTLYQNRLHDIRGLE